MPLEKEEEKSVTRLKGIRTCLCFLSSVWRLTVNDLIIGISRAGCIGRKMTVNEARVKDE